VLFGVSGPFLVWSFEHHIEKVEIPTLSLKSRRGWAPSGRLSPPWSRPVRFFARSGNGTVCIFFIGLTLPFQRVINARFALGSRE